MGWAALHQICEDRGLDIFHGKVSDIATNVAPPRADVVGIAPTVALGDRIYEPPVVPVMLAASARQHPSQVVIADSILQCVAGPMLQYCLQRLKKLHADERLMPTLLNCAFVSDVAGIVRVTQQVVELAVRDRLLRPPSGRAGC